MKFLSHHFDSDSLKVYFAALTGGTISSAVNTWIGCAVGLITFLYVGVKFAKQIRDWSKPDKD